MLEHLVAENHMDDAAEYMEHLKKEWNEISPEIKTGSPVIDVILMEKLREAKEKQIRFISDFHYPGDTKLNAFDLSVKRNHVVQIFKETDFRILSSPWGSEAKQGGLE